MSGLLLILISKSWGCPLPCPGMPFLDSDTCAKGGEGGSYFGPGFLPCMMPSMDGWRDEWMDGKLHEKRPRRPLLYVVLYMVCISLKQVHIKGMWNLDIPGSINWQVHWFQVALDFVGNNPIFFGGWKERHKLNWHPSALPMRNERRYPMELL
jgi:hypothetical protein